MTAPVLRVGCPMWAHRPWVARLFGPTAPGDELATYARWCSAVEGNTTFYALPRPDPCPTQPDLFGDSRPDR